MSYSNKNIWKFRNNVRSQNQYPLEEFYAVLMKKYPVVPGQVLSLCVQEANPHTEPRHLIYMLFCAERRTGQQFHKASTLPIIFFQYYTF